MSPEEMFSEKAVRACGVVHQGICLGDRKACVSYAVQKATRTPIPETRVECCNKTVLTRCPGCPHTMVRCHTCHDWHKLSDDCPKGARNTYEPYGPGIDVDVLRPVRGSLPTDHASRKSTPMCRGLLDYFPLACAEVARLSMAANEQHNPGEPMHWAREKSTDHADCVVRHLVDRGKLDKDGMRHTAKVAWRALALLQLELEGE